LADLDPDLFELGVHEDNVEDMEPLDIRNLENCQCGCVEVADFAGIEHSLGLESVENGLALGYCSYASEHSCLVLVDRSLTGEDSTAVRAGWGSSVGHLG
jgi:hypothetical protein